LAVLETDLAIDLLEDIAHAYHALIVEMTDDFKIRLKTAYAEDEKWKRVLAVLSG
jgi:hypothetical protein